MDLSPVTLQGQHVALVPMSLDHLDALWDAANDPDIWTYMPSKVKSKDECRQFIESALTGQQTQVELPFVVVELRSGSIVGSTRLLNISVPNRHVEIGWTWYNPRFWRSAVNTECKYLLMTHSFEHLEVVRVQICVDARNQRSRQAVLRLGAVHEGILRRHRVLSDGFIRDTCVYSVIDHEWPTVQSQLLHFLNEKYQIS